MRYGNKRDGNHGEIRNLYRSIPGCVVFDSADVGKGFPDLVVGWMGDVYLIEVKDGSLPPSKRKLTPDEREFNRLWSNFRYYVVCNADEALQAIGIDPTASVPF